MDASGNIVAKYEYSPFGKITLQNGAYASANPFRFSSEYHDDETGLVYYNFRYYSPELGRWTNGDPIEEEGGWNLYQMVFNNIVDWWDDLGNEKRKPNKTFPPVKPSNVKIGDKDDFLNSEDEATIARSIAKLQLAETELNLAKIALKEAQAGSCPIRLAKAKERVRRAEEEVKAINRIIDEKQKAIDKRRSNKEKVANDVKVDNPKKFNSPKTVKTITPKSVDN